MQLSAALTQAYNDQVQLEFESSFVYLQMGADFELRSLPGMASWMRLQSQEEHLHAMKFIQFVLDRGGKLQLKALAAPAPTPETVIACFETALSHEQRVPAPSTTSMRRRSNNTITPASPSSSGS